MIKFGVAGNSRSFYDEGNESTASAAVWCKERGIDVFEYSFGKGINLSDKTAEFIGKAFAEAGVEMTVHAPYYINFSNPDPEMIGKSILYVLNSLKKATILGGNRVVVHPATQGKVSREIALEVAQNNLKILASELEQVTGGDCKVCLETMGKLSQIGDEREIADFCTLSPYFIPCIDFGHLNARSQGLLRKKDDFLHVFDVFLEKLPFEKVKYTHIHFSKIMYGSKGEIKHLTFEDTEYGPEFEPLGEAIFQLGLEPYIICESDGTQAEDTVAMKKTYKNLLK